MLEFAGTAPGSRSPEGVGGLRRHQQHSTCPEILMPNFNAVTVKTICGAPFLYQQFQGSVGRPNFMDDSFAFINAVLTYRQNPTFQKAREIYAEFIKMGSPQEINVASA